MLTLPLAAPARQSAPVATPPVAPASASATAEQAFRAFDRRAAQPGVRAYPFDPSHTRFGFELRTRWGQRVQGQFPVYDGVALFLPDGRRQVRIRLAAGAIDVAGSERYAAIARSEAFFDAEHYPDIEFVSEPHDDLLTREGGLLQGVLRMHGTTRAETFVVAPALCDRAGQDCDAIASGSVDRSHYGIAGMRLVLSDRVRFTMRVRLDGPAR
ncbi:YceI family protein [Lysobacter sp. H21R4]|nr:YceI family protein [Lysobacter sp. H21R4]